MKIGSQFEQRVLTVGSRPLLKQLVEAALVESGYMGGGDAASDSYLSPHPCGTIGDGPPRATCPATGRCRAGRGRGRRDRGQAACNHPHVTTKSLRNPLALQLAGLRSAKESATGDRRPDSLMLATKCKNLELYWRLFDELRAAGAALP